MRIPLLAVALAMGWPASGTLANAAATPPRCAQLAGTEVPASAIGLPTGGASITSAVLKPGTGDAVALPDRVPEFCMVQGVIRSLKSARHINFRVAVPSNWNGNAIQIGGNGFNGFIPRLASFIRGAGGSPMGPAYPPDRPFPIAQGYATFGSDSGHVTATGRPPGWTPATPEDGDPPLTAEAAAAATAAAAASTGAQGGPQQGAAFDWMGDAESLENYSHAQIKKTHDVALHIIQALRGKAPARTYFMGESQGGRDALVAASRYGADYDGVLVSVPLSYFTGLLMNGAYQVKAQLDPAAWVPPAKEATLVDDVVKNCDNLDGLADGIIHNYMACYRRYDASITPQPFAALRCAGGADTGSSCFSDPQIATLQKFFSPMPFGFPMRNGETDWPGNPIGGKGAGTGSVGRFLLKQAPDPARPAGGQPVGMMFGLLLGNPNGFDYFNKSHAELQQQIQAVSAVLDAPVDWTALMKHGGKLVFHSAGTDYLTNSRSHMRVYEQAVQRHGQRAVDRAVRFYVTPNGDHGAGGVSSTTGEPTPRYMDLVSVLTNWVEKGATPPDAIEQRLMDPKPPYAVGRTRPLCRYPAYPHYVGGDAGKMQAYRCRVAAAPRARAPASEWGAIGDAVQKRIDAKAVPGAVTLVARNGRVLWLDARGNVSPEMPLRTDTVFWVASMTKPLVATAVMMMVEAGKVSLDDPVSKFIPEFSAPRNVRVAGAAPVPADKPLTVRQLLTHTSGLQSIGVPNDTVAPIAVGDTLATHVPKLASATLEFQPGSKWAYSNATGFDVLARIVEVASGSTFYDFVQRRILDPLGMTSTSFGPRADLASRTMPVAPPLAANPCVNGKTYACGSAGLWSTAEDYARFAQMLADGGRYRGQRLLRTASVAAMSSNQTGKLFPGSSGVPGADKGVGFGLSMVVVDDNAAAGLAVPTGSFGWDGVGTRRFWAIPKQHTVIVMLVPSGNAAQLHRDVERAAMDAISQR